MCHVDYLLAQLGIGCGSYEQVKNTCLFSYLFSRARDTTPWFDADGVGGSKFYWEQDHYPGQQRTAILAVFSYTPFPQSDKYFRAAMGGISPRTWLIQLLRLRRLRQVHQHRNGSALVHAEGQHGEEGFGGTSRRTDVPEL